MTVCRCSVASNISRRCYIPCSKGQHVQGLCSFTGLTNTRTNARNCRGVCVWIRWLFRICGLLIYSALCITYAIYHRSQSHLQPIGSNKKTLMMIITLGIVNKLCCDFIVLMLTVLWMMSQPRFWVNSCPGTNKSLIRDAKTSTSSAKSNRTH